MEGGVGIDMCTWRVLAKRTYGGVREGLDYLKEDIFTIFKNKLGEEYIVNVDYTVTEITEKETVKSV